MCGSPLIMSFIIRWASWPDISLRSLSAETTLSLFIRSMKPDSTSATASNERSICSARTSAMLRSSRSVSASARACRLATTVTVPAMITQTRRALQAAIR